ncbi:MAG: DUF4159 domain-containing protein [Acidobacteriota bacterium]
MRRSSRRRWFYGALLALMIIGLADLALAQRPYQMVYEPTVVNVGYDGRFTFARLKYPVAPGGYYYYGMPAWAHGLPRAEDNLLEILHAITAVPVRRETSNVFALDDPELTKYPVAYMTEAGYWQLTNREAAAFRAYLLKGGFAIFDDFRPPPRGGGGWETFEANMRRILPEARIVDLTPFDPIFHCFFDIETLDIIPQDYDLGRPVIRGIYENNDRTRRLIAVINFNTDVANFWEFSATGLKPVDETNEAYKLGVNYVIYGITH